MVDIVKLAEAVAAELGKTANAEVMFAPELDLKGLREMRIIVVPLSIGMKPLARGSSEDTFVIQVGVLKLFSFNNPIGACPLCEGYGKVVGIDENLVIPDKSKSIYDGAVACWNGATMGRWKQELILNSSKCSFPIHTPYHALTDRERDMLWRGTDYFHGIDDFFQYVDTQRHKVQYRVLKSRYMGKTLCPECHGTRLKPEALYVKVGGKNIAELVQMTVGELIKFFDWLTLDEHDQTTAERVLKEPRAAVLPAAATMRTPPTVTPSAICLKSKTNPPTCTTSI